MPLSALDTAPNPATARQLMANADIILSNHSGGKDSGAMLAVIATLAAELGILDRVQVVHNPLGVLEWPGSAHLAQEHAEQYGVRYVERAADADLLDLVRARRLWMDALARYCTAAMKRGHGTPITLKPRQAPGADRLAYFFALAHGWAVEPHPANWSRHGRAAGPARNRHMASLGADVCLAFPGGQGTRRMVEFAEAEGIPVVPVGWS